MQRVVFVVLPLATRKQSPTEQELQYFDRFFHVMLNSFGTVYQHSAANYHKREIPFWATILSSYLDSSYVTSQILDLSSVPLEDLDEHRGSLLQGIAGDDSTIYCFSPYTSNYAIARDVNRWIKLLHKDNAKTLIGGPHATYDAKACIHDGFDFAVIGRGELLFNDLVSAIFLNDNRLLAMLPNLIYRHNHTILCTEPIPKTACRQLPKRPNYTILPRDFQIDVIRIFTSYGCPYNCSFCANVIWKHQTPLFKPISLVLDEIDELFARFGQQPIMFGDEVFTIRRDRLTRICNALAWRGIQWYCQTRVDSIDKEKAQLLAASGCRLIYLGVETADERLMRLLDKRIGIDDIEPACAVAKQAGLNVITFWMVGVPGETRQSAEKTQDKIVDLIEKGYIDFANYYICVPYPGTAIYEDPSFYGVSIDYKAYSEWREDQESIMRTAALTQRDIYCLWAAGIERITRALASQA